MLFLNDAAMMDLILSHQTTCLFIFLNRLAASYDAAPPKALCELLFKRPQVGFDVLTKEGQADKPQLLFARAVARNCSFRFGNSFIRFSASSREITTRRGRSILISFEVFNFFMTSFCMQVFVCQSTSPKAGSYALRDAFLSEKILPKTFCALVLLTCENPVALVPVLHQKEAGRLVQ